jgi:hypothetical protein
MNERTAHNALSDRAETHREVIRILGDRLHCHPACAIDCNECVRARSESVGAEWETEEPGRYDSDGVNLLYVAIGCVVGAILATVLAVHVWARLWPIAKVLLA